MNSDGAMIITHVCVFWGFLLFLIANLKLYYQTLSFIICLAFCSGAEQSLKSDSPTIKT